jgi:type VI secretion system protein ImpB
MKRTRPTARVEVDNVLAGDGSKLSVELKFESMDDFSPAAVARKVDSLRRLLELRTQLQEVRTRFGSSPKAKDWLDRLMQNRDSLKDALAQG